MNASRGVLTLLILELSLAVPTPRLEGLEAGNRTTRSASRYSLPPADRVRP